MEPSDIGRDGELYHVTNHGDAPRIVYDQFGRAVTIRVGSTMQIALPRNTVATLKKAIKKGSPYKIVKVGEGSAQKVIAPKSDDNDDENAAARSGKKKAPEASVEVSTNQQPSTEFVPPPEEEETSNTQTASENEPIDPETASAVQILALLGSPGLPYEDLLRHTKRLGGGAGLKQRPSKEELVKALRKIAAQDAK